jgi:hypothetical protein
MRDRIFFVGGVTQPQVFNMDSSFIGFNNRKSVKTNITLK